MKKRCISILLAVLILGIFPLGMISQATIVEEIGDWVITNHGEIINYIGSTPVVSVPEKIGRIQVTMLREGIFRGKTTVKELIVPEGIKLCAQSRSSFEKVTVGKGATVYSHAFQDCKNLKEVQLPQDLIRINGCSFKNCVALTGIEIPQTVTSIGSEAFAGCTSLTAVVLPDGVYSLEGDAFYGCTALKSLHISRNLNSVGIQALGFCGALEEITVSPEQKIFFNDSDGNLCQYVTVNDETRIRLIRAVTGKMGSSYTISEEIDELGSYCFSGAKNLQEVTIPKNVKDVSLDVFDGCANLRTIRLEGKPHIIGFGEGVKATVYYPGDTGEWDDYNWGKFGSNIKRKAYCTGIHKGETGTVVKEPTCTEPGLSENLCTLCAQTYLCAIPVLEHAFDEGVIILEPECDKKGERSVTCQDCGYTTTKPVAELGHPFQDSDYTYIEVPTCITAGKRSARCANCGYGRTERVSALGHDFSVFTPIYEEIPGYHSVGCSRCVRILDPEECTGEGVITEEATVYQTGIKAYSCATCKGEFLAPYLYRLSGSNRFETAFMVAEELKNVMGVEKLDAVIIASGADFADALSGSYLANKKKAPILLAYKEEQNQQVVEYVQNNLKDEGVVYILGGTAAVPDTVDQALAGRDIRRLAGENRFETNLLILQEAGIDAGAEILICTAENYADSLSASATGLPILLVYNKKAVLTDNQKKYLEGLSGHTFRIIGGESAVCAELMEDFRNYGSVDRLAGENRMDTSVLVAQAYFEQPKGVALVYGWNYPDGLCGGPLAYSLGMPLILTITGHEAAAAVYAQQNRLGCGFVLGGTGLISDGTARAVVGAAAELIP